MTDLSFLPDGPRIEAALNAGVESFTLVSPVRITGYEFNTIDTLVVSLTADGAVGRGEAAGLYYGGPSPREMVTLAIDFARRLERGLSRRELATLLPPGGLRNAIDCALWDLEAKLAGRPVWTMIGGAPPAALLTTFTCSAEEPDAVAAAATNWAGARAIKLKLNGDGRDAERVAAARAVRSDVRLTVDANQGFTLAGLDAIMPALVDAGVALIEQPLPVGEDAALAGFQSPIPLYADESAQHADDVARLAPIFDGVNIKLDKCGGLTAALAMIAEARRHGLGTMIGNMIASSLAHAPAFVAGQFCDHVDLDAPAFLASDRHDRVRYDRGHIDCPPQLWGYPATQFATSGE